MQIHPENEKPIFLQLAEDIEDSILKGIFAEETQIPSTTEVAMTLKINPATVNRGVNLLVDEGIIYKKRGVGMFVNSGARQRVLNRRKQAFFSDFVLPLLEEARKIGLSAHDLITMLSEHDQPAHPERNSQNE